MIVNADDLGQDAAANRGIVAGFERGLVTSATVMVNQPGFEEAVELVRRHGLEAHVGVHLVLTSGPPLTDEMRRLERFCDEGVFLPWHRDARVWRLSRSSREAVVVELTAQVTRARDAGLPITHLDSHHHVHNEWGVGSCVIAVARRMGIPFVRIARNCGPGIGMARSVYKRAFNARLRWKELARTRWFGDVTDWLHLQDSGASGSDLDDFELMTHPVLDEAGELVDALEGIALETLLEPVIGLGTATSYAGARRLAG